MKKFLYALLALAISFNQTVLAGTFNYYYDVAPDYKYANSINLISEQGIVHGYTDGTYRPAQILSRAELLKIVLEAFESQEIPEYYIESCFNDVASYEWHSRYVCFAKEKGYINGYLDGSFKPNQSVNLAEALKMIMEVYKIESYENFKIANPELDPWYLGIITLAEQAKFIPEEMSKVTQALNRGQMAEIIVRIQNFDQSSISDIKIDQSIKAFDPLNSENAFIPDTMQLAVPFTPQAPDGHWTAPYDEACEESSMVMVEYFIRSNSLDTQSADKEIVSLTGFVAQMGYGVDISAADMANIIENYYNRRSKVYSGQEVSIPNIKALLAQGYPIIVPFAGQYVGNKNYAYPGPPYHVAVITGYDDKYFYVNDPGTQFGESYQYDQQVFSDAIHDWGGSKYNVLDGPKSLIVVEDNTLLAIGT
ncbi:S-layer homology domain-containing protein [Candidatus Peregrinibacteria bacterium]|nr:S-layer homology domain-containing protein [Candidatus Peregrinibacteria bacterium]